MPLTICFTLANNQIIATSNLELRFLAMRTHNCLLSLDYCYTSSVQFNSVVLSSVQFNSIDASSVDPTNYRTNKRTNKLPNERTNERTVHQKAAWQTNNNWPWVVVSWFIPLLYCALYHLYSNFAFQTRTLINYGTGTDMATGTGIDFELNASSWLSNLVLVSLFTHTIIPLRSSITEL